MKISLDFETCSVLDLNEVGAYEYSVHADTLPIIAGFAVDDEPAEVINFDQPNVQRLTRFFHAISQGAEIHAWNANFEWNIWTHICVPRHVWPQIPLERFYCSMAQAACAGLPMKLEDTADALQTACRKDTAGHNLMMRMARPRGFDSNGRPRWWHREDKLKLEQLVNYNIADVNAEREVQSRLPPMSQRERRIWLVDQRMNARGLPVDRVLLGKLHEISQAEWLRLDQEITQATRGAVSGSTQNLRLLDWVRDRGYPHDTLGKDTLTTFVNSPAFDQLSDDAAKTVLLARHERAKMSAAKLRAMASYSRSDDIARNLTQYGGAVRTLRWAGRGPQIQNYPRPLIKHVDKAVEEILAGMDADGLRLLFGRPLDVVSSCLRSVFKAPDYWRFVTCDYHAIEAIVLGWLADFEDLLEVFRRGEDVYVFTAQGVGSDNRTLGKVLRLACGYAMGPDKFRATAATYGLILTPPEAQKAVDNFRKSNAPIVKFWHLCEGQAIKAIKNPTSTFPAGKISFGMANPAKHLKGSLLMKLPSGRCLVYRNARIENGRIMFWGVNQFTRRWRELDTYGGKLVENATQAVARDLLADAIVDLDQRFPDMLRTTVHDEIVAITTTEHTEALFNAMKSTMSTPPSWAEGMPLSAAGAITRRYGKM